MPIVNYVREHRRFIEYAADEKINANERLLWYALMHIMNARATGNDWPGDFIPIGNDRVLMYCPMGFDAMARARNGLKQKGLIDFKPGDKNKASPMYKMNYFYPMGGKEEELCAAGYPLKTDKNVNAPESYPQKTDNMVDKTGDNMGDNMGDKTGDNMGDIYININKDYTGPYPRENEKEQEEEDRYARARAEVAESWKAQMGMNPYPAIVNRIAGAQARYWKFEDGVIGYAIELAAGRGSMNPVGYVMEAMGEWAEHHVHTRTEAEQFAMLHMAANGGNEYMDPGRAISEMRAFREARSGAAMEG